MVQLEKRILQTLTANRTQTYNYKQVSAKINTQNEAQTLMVRNILQKLAEQKKIQEVSAGSYQTIFTEQQLIGKLSLTKQGYGFVIPNNGSPDVLVEEENLGTGLHDDIVELRLYPQRQRGKAIGKIIRIVERSQTQFVGIIRLKNQGRDAYLVPENPKIPFQIYIPQAELHHAKPNDKAVAQITVWQTPSGYPEGKIIENLGEAGTQNAEILGIAAEFGFSLQFPQNVIDQANQISDQIPETEAARRRDFRQIPTFTIDPHDAKDFDDALSLRLLPNQNLEIAIHIADVSHYIAPNSPLDIEAYRRATSVYLADRVVPMLPENISNHICSLRPNEEKCCFSAVFEVTPQAQIVQEWYGKTIILSTQKFSYEQAQQILDQPQPTPETQNWHSTLHTLNQIAHQLRHQRFLKGSITLESQELKFRFDEEGNIIEIQQKQRKDAHQLIEEFMLLANKQVATYITQKIEKKPAQHTLYRIHDNPDPERLQQLQQYITKFGYKINLSNPKLIASSLNQLAKEVENKPEANLIQNLAIRTMAKAIYTTKNIGHYGLAFPMYTHFTSPIRRYPDLLVHRILYQILQNDPNINQNLETQAKHCSEQERKAAQAERASIKYKQLQMLIPYIGTTQQAIVSSIKDYGIYVELQINFAEGLLRLSQITTDYYQLSPDQTSLIGQRTKKTINLGDPIEVEIANINLQTRQMDLKLKS